VSNFTDLMTDQQKKLWEELVGIWRTLDAGDIEIRLHQPFSPGWENPVTESLAWTAQKA
jgi:hypothetical protein